MTDAKKCPQCGTHLPADAPAGICPKCLLAVGMVNDTAVRGESSEGAPTTPLPGSTRFVPPAPAALAPLFPQLEILEMIGVGGMGAVYKARQPGLDRLVAIKILPPEVGADPAFAQRFTREAQALARLGHQHIVPVYDFGVAQGLYYFIMEYVDGANLRHLIKTGEMKPADALAIVPQICEALQFAHEEGVVHRDIKPENILIDKRGRVKIADFGLARLLGTAAPELSLTGTNQVLGTLHYMAPEQIQGLRTVDHRADIYSLGVVFYEMLTGELPLGRFAPPSQKIGVDVRLDEVVLRSLESKPERRYQHASEVKTDVETISRESSAADHRQAGTRPVFSESSNLNVAGLEASGSHVAAVRKPAIALMVVAGLGFFGTVLLLVSGFIWMLFSARNLRPSGVAVMLGLWYAPVVIVLTLLTVVGALSMRNCRRYGLAVTASVLAVLPLSIAWPIGLPIGLWALAVLTSPEVRAAFHRHAPPQLKSPAERLYWPAILLLAAGMVDFAEMLFFGAALIFAPRAPNDFFELLCLGILPAFLLGTLRVVGGIQMKRFGPYAFVCLAATASILPITWGSVLGLPVGIWALVVLIQADVKAAFAEKKVRQRNDGAVEQNRNPEQLPQDISPAIASTPQPEVRQSWSKQPSEDPLAAEERQRAAELAERAPAWLAFVELGLFGLGWLFVGAMWNYGAPGLYVGFSILAMIVYLSVRWNLIYLPKLQQELQRQSRLRRGFALVAGLIIFLFAMIFVSSAQTSMWDFVGNPSSFSSLPNYKEQQDQLYTVLKSAKLGDLNEKAFNIQSIGTMAYRSLWEPFILAAIGLSLVIIAIGVVTDTRRYRNSWKYGWGTAIGVTVLLFTMLTVVVPIFMPKGTGRLPSREIRSAATTDQLKTAIQSWGTKNGYKVDVQASGGGSGGGVRDLRLAPVEKLKPEDFGPGFAKLNDVSTSKDGKQYVVKDGKVWEQVSENFHDKFEVVNFRLLRPSALDQYRTSWHGTYRPRPPLTIACITRTSTRSERVHNTYNPETTTINTVAQIEPGWEWMGTPESELWEPILEELEADVRAASKTATARELEK